MQSNQYKANLFKLCIDSKENLCISGRMYNPTLKEPVHFEDSGIILLQMDKILDFNGYPQAFQNRRVFIEDQSIQNHFHQAPNIILPIKAYGEAQGQITTYEIQVNARQYSTWQGDVYDQNHHFLQHFDTVLELMWMIIEDLDRK